MYVLDTNVFLQPHNERYYSMDWHGAYWEYLDRLLVDGTAISAARAFEELHTGEPVGDWAQSRKGYFVPASTESVNAVSRITSDVLRERPADSPYTMPFLSKADPWIIAEAEVRGWTVVTFERPKPNATLDLKIPDVCNWRNVRCVSLWVMLEETGVRFGGYSL